MNMASTARIILAVPLLFAALVSPASKGKAKKLPHPCRPVLTNSIKPVWPEDIRGAKPKVILKFKINPDGTLSNTAVEKSSGRNDVDAAALSAFRKAKYKPLPAECGEIESKIVLAIDFAQ